MAPMRAMCSGARIESGAAFFVADFSLHRAVQPFRRITRKRVRLMNPVPVFEAGGYRYIKAVFQYSGGVAAQPEYWNTALM